MVVCGIHSKLFTNTYIVRSVEGVVVIAVITVIVLYREVADVLEMLTKMLL